MNPGLLLDITLIPAKLAGLAAVSKVLASAAFTFLLPFTILEMNVRALEQKHTPSYSGLAVRVLIVATCLIAYDGLFGFVLKLSQVMSFAVLSEQQWGDFLVQGLKGTDSTYPTLMVLVKNVVSVQGLLLFLSSLLTLIVREVVVMLQACFLSLLYAFGPLALVCAINEQTSRVTKGWLTNTFQVAMWSFFLRLAVRVWLTLSPVSAATGAGTVDDYVGILTVNLTYLILILGTPTLTARLLSEGNLAAFGEAALGAVGTVTAAKAMRGAGAISKEHASFQRAVEGGKGKLPYFQHPIQSTMTALYQRRFMKKQPEAAKGWELVPKQNRRRK